MTKADTDGQDTGLEPDEVVDGANAEPGQSGEGGGDDQVAGDLGEDGVVVLFGDEEAPASEEDDAAAPPWVGELRKRNRELARENSEFRRKVEEREAQARKEKIPEVGVKPTLEGCDFDSDKFERELEAWHERKRTAETKERESREQAEAGQRAWRAQLDKHGKLKTELKVSDFEDAEAALEGVLSVQQQGMIIHAADNSAVLLYALGKNPKKAKELASIADPVKFAFAVAKLETQLKVTPRRVAPPPEGVVRGSAAVTGTVDQNLARLEAEADKTGDRSKVMAYRRQLKQKSA